MRTILTCQSQAAISIPHETSYMLKLLLFYQSTMLTLMSSLSKGKSTSETSWSLEMAMWIVAIFWVFCVNVANDFRRLSHSISGRLQHAIVDLKYLVPLAAAAWLESWRAQPDNGNGPTYHEVSSMFCFSSFTRRVSVLTCLSGRLHSQVWL